MEQKTILDRLFCTPKIEIDKSNIPIIDLHTKNKQILLRKMQ